MKKHNEFLKSVYHHDPDYELQYAAQNGIREFICSDLQCYISFSSEEQELLEDYLIATIKDKLPHRWQRK